jgi:hypothetical protein
LSLANGLPRMTVQNQETQETFANIAIGDLQTVRP